MRTARIAEPIARAYEAGYDGGSEPEPVWALDPVTNEEVDIAGEAWDRGRFDSRRGVAFGLSYMGRYE